MREFSVIIALLLAVYGAAELLWRLIGRLLCPTEPGWLVLPLCGDRTDAEYLIRTTRLRGVSPVLLDRGLTPHAAALTREICRRLDTVFLTEKEWQEMQKTALQLPESGV